MGSNNLGLDEIVRSFINNWHHYLLQIAILAVFLLLPPMSTLPAIGLPLFAALGSFFWIETMRFRPISAGMISLGVAATLMALLMTFGGFALVPALAIGLAALTGLSGINLLGGGNAFYATSFATAALSAIAIGAVAGVVVGLAPYIAAATAISVFAGAFLLMVGNKLASDKFREHVKTWRQDAGLIFYSSDSYAEVHHKIYDGKKQQTNLTDARKNLISLAHFMNLAANNDDVKELYENQSKGYYYRLI